MFYNLAKLMKYCKNSEALEEEDVYTRDVYPHAELTKKMASRQLWQFLDMLREERFYCHLILKINWAKILSFNKDIFNCLDIQFKTAYGKTNSRILFMNFPYHLIRKSKPQISIQAKELEKGAFKPEVTHEFS